jgi:hypothetical protein
MCHAKFIAIAAACHAMRTSSGEPIPFNTLAKSSGVRGVGNNSKRVKGFCILFSPKCNTDKIGCVVTDTTLLSA